MRDDGMERGPSNHDDMDARDAKTMGYVYRDAEERYLHDATYRCAVDSMGAILERMQLTPGELRDAAMLAAIRFEMTRTRLVLQRRAAP